MARLKSNRSQAFALSRKKGNNPLRLNELKAQIMEDELKLEQSKSRVCEQAFNSRNDEESVNS